MMSSKELILNKIADYLARRDHSVQEIKEKLAQKKIYDPQEIDEALQIAQDKKWFLPEEELAQKVARNLYTKYKSHFFVQNYLRDKGLPTVAFSEENEENSIKSVLRKKFGSHFNLDYEKKQKALRLLSGRGFNPELCYKVLGQYHEEL